MPIERMPSKPLPASYVPAGGAPYRVSDGDDWKTVAAQWGINVHALIEFNFETTNPDEVNWYLRRNTGCNKATRDGKNWMFSSSATPGVIYIPPFYMKGERIEANPGRKNKLAILLDDHLDDFESDDLELIEYGLD